MRVPASFAAWLAIIACGAAVLMALWFASRPQEASPLPQQGGTFTSGGVTWNCPQVMAWDRQYGAYEPDGTPIPYAVVIGCGNQ